MSTSSAHFLANITTDFYTGLVSTTTPPDTTPPYVGYVCALVAIIFYGSNFVPVKQFETGDGMFFQWILCSGIFIVGLVVNIVRRSIFYPLAMVGGVVWCTGNLCVVPILKTIGLSLGLCLWATANLLAGWFSARFGMFGIKKEIPGNEIMNDISVFLAVLSAVVYTQVKSDISMSQVIQRVEDPDYETGITQATGSSSRLVSAAESETIYIVQTNTQDKQGLSFFEKLPPLEKRLLGITLAIISGIFYGLNFTPAIYIQDRIKSSSKNGIDYVFAHVCGIFMASTLYFIIYVIYQRNKPKIYPTVILPGLLSGVMWAVATACFFVANEVLSEPVSFPIINTGPALIASGWGVLLFKEITGKKNLLILSFAFCLTISTGVLAGFSKSTS